MSAYQLSADVVVRAESFGGMLFHSRTGATIELDREAFESLVAGTLLADRRGRKVARTLIAQGLALLGAKIRADIIMKGDYRSLYIVWEKFAGDWHFEEEEKEEKKGKKSRTKGPKAPADMGRLPSYLKALKSVLITTDER